MSFLNDIYAAPGRMRGVYRYLLREGRPVLRDEVERMISPDSLLKSDPEKEAKARKMVRSCVLQGVNAKLFTEDEDGLSLSPELPGRARNPKTGDETFYRDLADLFGGQGEGGPNADMLVAVAWLMTCDPRDFIGPQESAERQMSHDGFRDEFGSPNPRWGQLEDWASVLGFAATYEQLAVDPTPFVRDRLDTLFGDEGSLALPEATKRLAGLCPAFDGGWASRKVFDLMPQDRRPRPPRLLAATSTAWLRLQAERLVRLEREADSKNMMLLRDGDVEISFSRVNRL